ncbi:MAG: RAD55 family ATPase [Candidatus Thermoplasmatota archaeon]|nr:RAD55 family ATPase [Candidatus Thermoplasmatota archaeon]
MRKDSIRKQLKRLRISKAQTPPPGEKWTYSDQAISSILGDMKARQKLAEQLEEALATLPPPGERVPPKNTANYRWGELVRREERILRLERSLQEREEHLRAELERMENFRAETKDVAILEKLQKMNEQIAKLAVATPSPAAPGPSKLSGPRGSEGDLSNDSIEGGALLPTKPAGVETGRDSTGVPRLDDLLQGGLPLGCNILLNGSRHMGNDVLARFLVAAGLRRSIPAIWVLTDRDRSTLRESMIAILPEYPEFEAQGLVSYVDLYSTRIGRAELEENVVHISVTETEALEKLGIVVRDLASVHLKRAPYYHLVFQSVSTLTASMDSQAILRFLLPFTGMRLKGRAIAYSVVEAGTAQPGEIELLENMMEGAILFKTEGTKTFLSVKGIVDEVRSRSWISYSFSRTQFNLGSFSLTHIR